MKGNVPFLKYLKIILVSYGYITDIPDIIFRTPFSSNQIHAKYVELIVPTLLGTFQSFYCQYGFTTCDYSNLLRKGSKI
jgi:hypothetical protein